MELKLGMNIDFDNIVDEFEGQSHRSKVNVAIMKKNRTSDGFTYADRDGLVDGLCIGSHHFVCDNALFCFRNCTNSMWNLK